ncbi:MAG: hypothetical protein GY851_24385, partial [bacterium]|nr:hypothetical protein [bacterium]
MKFSPTGEFLLEWGGEGTGPSQFDHARDMAVGALGYVYVVDSQNYRIQKFSAEGEFIQEWGGFTLPTGIAVDNSDGEQVYVADTNGSLIKKFTSDGSPLGQWEFHGPTRIAVDTDGMVYVTSQHQVNKFTPDGEHLTGWGSYGSEPGKFDMPSDIAVGDGNTVYVRDNNGRVQHFTSNGQFLTQWTSRGSAPSMFIEPTSAGSDSVGNVYVVDVFNDRIQKFDANGHFLLAWGSVGSEPGQFSFSYYVGGITVDTTDVVWVADPWNNRVQKFTTQGEFLSEWQGISNPNNIAVDRAGMVYVTHVNDDYVEKLSPEGVSLLLWGGTGTVDGTFDGRKGIAVGPDGTVFVADANNDRVQKFDANGTFLTKWGTYGTGDGQFDSPRSVAVDASGNVYVGDYNYRIQKFSANGAFLTKWGSGGTGPGQMRRPPGIAVDASGRVYVANSSNNRVQKFVPMDLTENSKAIVVAGGGSFDGNNLWDATQSCANFAYRALNHQGFTKETIYYLSSDTDLDLDSNGEADDVDADATNASLQYALETWAGAEHNGLPTGDVVVYLVDHGGPGTFRMGPYETLASTELGSWLDTLQAAVSGTVTVVYDACESGTFVADCAAPTGYEDKRIVATSTSPGESAYFVTQGTVSFSNYFWTQIFNGVPVGTAFDLAAQALSQTYDYQTPLLEDNGNAVANDTGDGALAATTHIGNGVQQFWEGPEIGAVVGEQTINGTSTATLWADPVTDDDGVARVWAVIRPPDYEQESSSNPVAGLPTIDLQIAGGDRFEADYDAFTTPGTYTVLIYARDRVGNTSVPVLTSVTVTNPLKRRAVLVAGGTTSDVDWPAYERTVTVAYDALRFQGYDDEDIYFMSPMGLAGVDVAPSVSNIQWALSTAQNTMTQDMMLYLVGPGSASGFMVSGTEVLDAPTLDGWLDTLQAAIPGTITVVYDADQSGVFLPDLTAPTGYEDQRIVIASASSSQQAAFLRSGTISFSKFFWVRVLNGADTFEAWSYARAAMRFAGYGQTAHLDDPADGLTHPVYDGIVSRDHYIGMGILLAGDDPLIGSIVAAQDLTGTDSATLWVDDVTTTGVIDRVWAVVTLPDNDVTTVELLDVGGGRYEAAWSGFGTYGTYGVAAFATDTEGNVSAPAETEVRRLDGPDAYEDDDTAATATWTGLVYAGGTVQTHNFHDAGDADWVAFDST